MWHVGIDVGGTFTDLFAANGESGATISAEGADHRRRPLGGRAERAGGRRDRTGGDQCSRARHHDRNQRAGRAQLPAGRHGHDRGLSRCHRDRAPAPAAPVRAAPEAAHAHRASAPALHPGMPALRFRRGPEPFRQRRGPPSRASDQGAGGAVDRHMCHQRLRGRSARSPDAGHPAGGISRLPHRALLRDGKEVQGARALFHHRGAGRIAPGDDQLFQPPGGRDQRQRLLRLAARAQEQRQHDGRRSRYRTARGAGGIGAGWRRRLRPLPEPDHRILEHYPHRHGGHEPSTHRSSITAKGCSPTTTSSNGKCRSPSRCWISAASAPAAVRSPGSTRAARCVSGRRARAPIRVRPATTGAGTRRRSRMRTSCSAGWTPRWAASSPSMPMPQSAP